MATGGPDGDLRELLKLYRDRDARDAKIRTLEKALVDARRVTPDGSQEEIGRLEVQVQQLQGSVADWSRMCDELRGIKNAHEATINSLRSAIDKSLQSTIDEDFRSAELLSSGSRLKLAIPTSIPGSSSLDGHEREGQSALQAHIVDLRMQLQQAKSLHAQLTSKTITLQARIEELEEERERARDLEVECEKKTRDLAIAEARATALIAELDVVSQQISRLKASYNEKLQEATSLAATVLDLTARAECAENQYGESVVRVADLSQQNELLQADLKGKGIEFEKKLAAANRDLASVRATASLKTTRVAELETEVSDLETRLCHIREEKASLTVALEGKECELTGLNVKLVEKDEQLAASVTQKKGLEARIATLNEALREARRNAAYAIEMQTKSAFDLNDIRSGLAIVQATAAEKASRVAELEMELADLTTRFGIMHEEKAALGVTLEGKQAELAAVNAKLDEKNAEIQEALNLKGSLEAEMAEVREKLSELATLKDQVVDSEKLAAKLGGELAAASQHANNVQADLDTSRKKLAVLEPLELEVVNLRARVTLTHAELETATAMLAKLKSLEKDYESLCALLVHTSQPLTPQADSAATPTPAGPVKEEEITLEDKKPSRTYAEKDVQAESPLLPSPPAPLPEPPIPEYTNRLKPWSANESVDFKMWLRHKILRLTDVDCLRPIARSPVDALKRYNFTMQSIMKVHGLSWETDKAGVYRVPKDFDAYRNAEFTMDTVRESIGVEKKVWDADYSIFGQGVDDAPLVKAWILNPDDPHLLAMFGNMTHDQFSIYKATGEKISPPMTPTGNLKQGKKRARKSTGGSEGPSASKKLRSSSDATPPAST